MTLRLAPALRRARARLQLAFGRPSFLAPFSAFSSTQGASGVAEFHRALAAGYPSLRRKFRRALPNPETDSAWVKSVEKLCRSAALDHVFAPGAKLKAYCDEATAAAILIVLLARLSEEVRLAARPIQLCEAVAGHMPFWRGAWLALARLQLDASQAEEARNSAGRALALRGDCPDAQRLLQEAQTAAGALPGFANGALKERFCSLPFETLTTARLGNKLGAYLCDCGGWLPFSAGDLQSAGSVEEVWNSPVASEIRRSILDGDFQYCSRTLCPHLVAGTLPKRSQVTDPRLCDYIQNRTTVLKEGPRALQFSHDATCNLACPSCREELLGAKAGERAELERIRDTFLLPLLKRTEGTLLLTGWGDPFASKHYLSVLQALNQQKFPRLTLELQTNGLLFTPRLWESLPGIHGMIGSLRVSIDAATPDTYAIVRRPGRWNQLWPNLEFMSRLRQSGQLAALHLCFVVQKQNFREMPAFVHMGLQLAADRVVFLKPWNFGSWTEAQFQEADVTAPGHPLYAEFARVWQHPVLSNACVSRFNLSAPAGL